jgi:hypothetical protein
MQGPGSGRLLERSGPSSGPRRTAWRSEIIGDAAGAAALLRCYFGSIPYLVAFISAAHDNRFVFFCKDMIVFLESMREVGCLETEM